MLPNKKLFKT